MITATVLDPNPSDSHSFDWSRSSNVLVDSDAAADTFTFDASTLTAGTYIISLEVKDNGTPALSTIVTTHIYVKNSAPVLTNDDSDGDGVSDADEGYDDSDGDRVPDYLDSTETANVIQSSGNDHNRYLLESKPGLSMRIGEIAMSAETHGGQVSAQQIKEKSGHSKAEDTEASNIGGYFDFEVNGLSDIGQSVEIVIPQRAAIPAGAIYRKLMPTVGWMDFVLDSKNKIHSAAGSDGYCPSPNSDEYTEGLTAGHWCVQLTIEDGGPNDGDGIANGTVVDPGGVSVMNSATSNQTVSAGTSGGGAIGHSLLALFIVFVFRAKHYRD